MNMDNSIETVEIDVKHSSRRQITADGDEMKICFAQNSNNRSPDDGVSKKHVRIVEDTGSQNMTSSYEIRKLKSPDNKDTKVCQFYKRYGKCKFENDCFYLHHKPLVDSSGKGDRNFDSYKSDGGQFKQNNMENAPDGKLYFRETNGENSYLNINSSNTKPCRFFMQKKGCKFGDNCPFIHYRSVGDAGADMSNNISEQMKNISTQDTFESKEESRKLNGESKTKGKKKQPIRKCLFFIKDGVCRNGDHCAFSHILKNEEKQIMLSPPNDFEFKEQNTNLKDRNNSTNSKTPKKCYYFKRNGCRLKEACPFLHEPPETIKSGKGKINVKSEENCSEYMQENDVEGSDNEQLNKSIGEEKEGEYSDQNEQLYNRILDDPSNSSMSRTNQYCTFFLTPKGCFRGEKCQYLHPVADSDPPDTDNYQLLQETEYKQLEKRFSVDNKFKLLQSQPSTIYSVIFEPSDPDWGIVVKEFVLLVEFPAEYPKTLFDISLEDDEIYPEGFTCFMNEGIHGWIKERQQDRGGKDLAFRPFLKWFDRNVESLVLDAGRKVKQLRDAQEAGFTLIPHHNILPNAMEPTESEERELSPGDSPYQVEPPWDGTEYNNVNATSNQDINNGDIDVNEILQTDSMKIANTNTAKASNKVKMGTELKFSHLEVNENVASMFLKNLLLIVQCIRCKSRTEFSLQSKKKITSVCKKCRVSQSATFYPEIIHQYSHVAGYLHLDGCKASDAVLLDSSVILNCLNCSKDNIKKGIAYGKKGDYWCEFCHTKMDIQIVSCKFTQLQKNGEKLQEVKPVSKKAVKYPGIKEGSPLPDNGTCKHYKKSYRWLRFPCCGKVYPCDICHEEGEENDHEMKFATRMVCGYCSKEQPFAKEKPCIACKANVTKSRSSHWEGGKGCRNRTAMDRNENRKTAGLGKTISRKKAADT